MTLQIVTLENAFLWQRNPTIRAYIAILTTPPRFGIGGKGKDFLRNKQEKREKSFGFRIFSWFSLGGLAGKSYLCLCNLSRGWLLGRVSPVFRRRVALRVFATQEVESSIGCVPSDKGYVSSGKAPCPIRQRLCPTSIYALSIFRYTRPVFFGNGGFGVPFAEVAIRRLWMRGVSGRGDFGFEQPIMSLFF